MYFTRFNTELCEIILAGDEQGLKHLHLNTGEGKRRFEISQDWQRNDSLFTGTVIQIKEYITGVRKHFDVKLNPEGTEFQKKVWKQLQKVPYAETRTYGEIAGALGNRNASRAVGAANGKNPIPLIIPCHRVIGSSGNLTGYAHGIAAKNYLLELEKSVLNKR